MSAAGAGAGAGILFQFTAYHCSDETVHGIDPDNYNQQTIARPNVFYYPPDKTPWGALCFHIYLVGRCADARSIVVRVPFRPLLVLRVLQGATQVSTPQQIAEKILKRCGDSSGGGFGSSFLRHGQNFWWEAKQMHDAAGFHPDVSSTQPAHAKFPFLFLRFSNRCILNKFVKDILPGLSSEAVQEERFMRTHPIVQFFQESRLQPCSTVRIKKFMLLPKKISYSDLEFHAELSDLEPVHESVIYPIKVLAVDIETVPGEGSHFPDPAMPDDKIVCICGTVKILGRVAGPTPQQSFQVIHALGEYNIPEPSAPGTNITHFTYKTEAELLLGWRDYLVWSEDPDIITGWNIDGYDWNYINKRAVLHRLTDSRFFHFSKFIRLPSVFTEKRFSSGAYGTMDALFYKIPGRINMDLLTYVRRNYKSDNYRLDTISRLWLGQTKNDLPIKTMFEYWKSGDPELRSKVNFYCLQDTLLPILMLEKKIILPTVVEMSRVTYVCLEELFSAGQSLKVISMLYIFARENGFVLSSFPEQKGDYEGATVLDVVAGLHETVTVFDFSSLYPSIIRAYNLDYTSYVADSQERLSSYQYETVVTDVGKFTFQQTLPGLLPSMCRTLLERRSAAKKAMQAAEQKGDDNLSQIMNAKQNALKVSANSIYGFTGASQVCYPLKAIAASTTAQGRMLLRMTVQLVEGNFSAKILMGDTDSVFVKLTDPVTKKSLSVAQCFEKGREIEAFCNKAYKAPINITLEKVLSPLLAVAKKKYAGCIFMRPDDSGSIYVKGLGTVRRDFTPFQRMCLDTVLKNLLTVRDPKAALALLEEQFKKLCSGLIPLAEIIKTAQLKAEYKSKTIPAKLIADRVNAEFPNTWRIGDRVEMVAVVRKQPLKYECERMEDPRYVESKKLKIDYSYYMEGLQTSISQFFVYFGYGEQVARFFRFYIHTTKAKLSGLQMFSFQPVKRVVKRYGT